MQRSSFCDTVTCFVQVDLIEPSQHLLSKAKANLAGPGHKCAPEFRVSKHDNVVALLLIVLQDHAILGKDQQ
jgi:hypothetical protein